MEAIPPSLGKSPLSHRSAGGRRPVGKSMPLNKKPYLWEKASHTRNLVTAKSGKHQWDLVGALLWAACWQRGLTQLSPES